jgi:hypothetical protein
MYSRGMIVYDPDNIHILFQALGKNLQIIHITVSEMAETGTEETKKNLCERLRQIEEITLQLQSTTLPYFNKESTPEHRMTMDRTLEP